MTWSFRAFRMAAVALGASLCGLAATPQASAAPLDLRIDRMFSSAQKGADGRIDSGPYKLLMREVGLAIGPRMAGPAQSLGPLGLDASFELSSVGAHTKTWEPATDAATDTLTTSQLRVRKGLPHSMQLGTVLTHLWDSNLWAIGAELNLSLIDGYKYVPDLSVRPSVHTELGSSSFDMLIAGTDVALSKSIGVFGLFALQPWAAYSFTFTHVYTPQLPVFENDKAIRPEPLTIKPFQEYAHRGQFGVRVVAARAQVGVEFLHSFSDDLTVLTGSIGAAF